jgi:hypothetical protein
MIPLTNPFSEPSLDFELHSRGELSPFISRREREDRVIDAVSRVIKLRVDACESMRSIFYEAIMTLAERPCFLAEHSLSTPSDMLALAARLMDVFNQCLGSRISANAAMQDAAKSRLESILDQDFSLDPIPQSGAVTKSRLFVVYNPTFWEEEKVVEGLLKFGHE